MFTIAVLNVILYPIEIYRQKTYAYSWDRLNAWMPGLSVHRTKGISQAINVKIGWRCKEDTALVSTLLRRHSSTQISRSLRRSSSGGDCVADNPWPILLAPQASMAKRICSGGPISPA